MRGGGVRKKGCRKRQGASKRWSGGGDNIPVCAKHRLPLKNLVSTKENCLTDGYISLFADTCVPFSCFIVSVRDSSVNHAEPCLFASGTTDSAAG